MQKCDVSLTTFHIREVGGRQIMINVGKWGASQMIKANNEGGCMGGKMFGSICSQCHSLP